MASDSFRRAGALRSRLGPLLAEQRYARVQRASNARVSRRKPRCEERQCQGSSKRERLGAQCLRPRPVRCSRPRTSKLAISACRNLTSWLLLGTRQEVTSKTAHRAREAGRGRRSSRKNTAKTQTFRQSEWEGAHELAAVPLRQQVNNRFCHENSPIESS